ncbi:histidine kinase [Massilia sp. NR 4-1]|nr:histidine kinase [Massilia sp. NR 4-1]
MRFLPSCWRRPVASLVAAACLVPSAFARDVNIGVFAYQGEYAAVSDWSPLISYLNHSLPEHRFQMHSYDAAGMRKAIADRQVDLVITNPGYYVTMEAEFGLSRIATLESMPGVRAGHASGSAIIVRASDSPLRELTELDGKRVAAVAPEAFGGYLVAARELLRFGIDMESDLQELRFVGLPMMNVVQSVRSGMVDAGIVRSCFLEQMEARGQLRMADFRVLSPRRESGLPCAVSTALYPDWPVAVTRQTDPVLAKAVAQALLAMPASASGMSWSVPADYQPVHELYRELRAGPYAYLREITPGGLARRFWPWLLGLTALVAAWIVHTVRAEQLVHRRTAELRESLRARQAAEARMRDSQEQMEHLSRLSVLGELSGNLAHEINQPLTTIGNYARSVLRRQSDSKLTPEAITEACSEIVSEAERAGGIVQRIRHFAKKRSAVREPLALTPLAHEAKRLVSGMLANAPDIAIESRTPGGCCALADGPQIQQVLLNLIKNAIDAGRGLPAERQGIRVEIGAADKRTLVQVIDQGAGLPEEQREQLFQPFFTTKPDGLGLGLSICKTIIESHGGRLWAETNPDGCGMRFIFSLPCHESSTPSVSCPRC